jgi:hypothetical protein
MKATNKSSNTRGVVERPKAALPPVTTKKKPTPQKIARGRERGVEPPKAAAPARAKPMHIQPKATRVKKRTETKNETTK